METRERNRTTLTRDHDSTKIDGASAAAILAAGIGSFAVGLMTTLAEAIAGLAASLNFVPPVGPLSGKTTVAVLVWLAAWAILHFSWRDRERELGGIYTATLVLILLGVLGTFPIFFELFAA